MQAIHVVAMEDYTLAQVHSLYDTVFAKNQVSNFFLSQLWIENWLSCAKHKPLLIQFIQNKTPVGFAFLGVQKSKLGDIFYLNQCGDQKDDQIWIEYNDVICQSNHDLCRQAILNYIASKPRCFQFICINAEHDKWQSTKWSNWSKDPVKGFASDLSHEPISSHFSKNTKSQISRSRNFIEKELGEIKMTWIDENSVEDALSEMAKLHIKQWGSHSYGSGFSNDRFNCFHHQLMINGHSSFARCAKFSAGSESLGYLYFLIQGKTVYFYLSAINYCVDSNKFKPGLVMHKMAMEYFQSKQYNVYDFLAGFARYKTSLANNEYTLFNLKLYANLWYYKPIKALIKLKRLVFSKLKK